MGNNIVKNLHCVFLDFRYKTVLMTNPKVRIGITKYGLSGTRSNTNKTNNSLLTMYYELKSHLLCLENRFILYQNT
jgi:hypothetical protein